jgi:hypothetical protein
MSERDMLFDLMRKIERLEKRIEELERREPGVIRYKEANVTNPPTNAELDAAFGDATTALFNGFVGIVFDTDGIGAVAHLAAVANDTWYLESLTLAA